MTSNGLESFKKCKHALTTRGYWTAPVSRVVEHRQTIFYCGGIPYRFHPNVPMCLQVMNCLIYKMNFGTETSLHFITRSVSQLTNLINLVFSDNFSELIIFISFILQGNNSSSSFSNFRL